MSVCNASSLDRMSFCHTPVHHNRFAIVSRRMRQFVICQFAIGLGYVSNVSVRTRALWRACTLQRAQAHIVWWIDCGKSAYDELAHMANCLRQIGIWQTGVWRNVVCLALKKTWVLFVQPEEIFLTWREKNWKFDNFRGKFSNPYHRWLTQPDPTRVKKFWPGPITRCGSKKVLEVGSILKCDKILKYLSV